MLQEKVIKGYSGWAMVAVLTAGVIAGVAILVGTTALDERPAIAASKIGDAGAARDARLIREASPETDADSGDTAETRAEVDPARTSEATTLDPAK